MKTRITLLLGLLLSGFGLLLAQNESIPADLSTLSQLTLGKSPAIQRQNIQVNQAKANKQSATGQFDLQLYSNFGLNRYGLTPFDADPRKAIVSNIQTNSLDFSGGVQRMFRNGMTTRVGFDYNRLSDNFPLNNFNENVGPFVSDNVTNTNLTLTQPLMRGRGTNIVTANEKAGELGTEAQQYNVSFVASSELFNMAIAYWQYLGAFKSLEIYRENQARVTKVLEITNELVKADKKPATELLQIQADLKDKEQQTIIAEQQLYNARQNLGRAIGINILESERLAQPANVFPEIAQVSAELSLNQLMEIARKNRPDLKALKKSLESSNLFVDVAENSMRPQLDLSAFAAYGGAIAGNGIDRFFSALGQSQGRNYRLGLGLNFMFPVQNNRAKANLLANQLQVSDLEINIENQIRNIELNVSIAHNNFQNSIAALKKSKEALDYYTEVFRNEQFKFQTGLTTLLNLILFQERLTFAQLGYIQSQQQFAVAISNLRFETGTLYPSEQNQNKNQVINPEVLYSLPKE
jgi:outer membrane protein